MTEIIAFVQAVGVPAAIALILILHTGPRIDKLIIAVMSLGRKIAICPFQPNPNPGSEEKEP